LDFDEGFVRLAELRHHTAQQHLGQHWAAFDWQDSLNHSSRSLTDKGVSYIYYGCFAQ
jgi:hypothetical protein